MADKEDNMENTSNDVLAAISSDDTYSQFFDDSFDAKEYANGVIGGKNIGEALGSLSHCIKLLNEEIHNQVSAHHEDLLSQATGIETLEGVLQMIQARIKTLRSSADRLQTQIVDPYNRIASRTGQLRRLQNTCDILRRIVRMLALRKRLDTQLSSGVREIAKAAQSLNELEYVLEGVDLAGIHIVEEDVKFITKARKDVEKQAHEMFGQGLGNQNQAQTGVALQVFHNLGLLKEKVQGSLSEFRTVFRDKVRKGLDTQQIALIQGPSQGPGRALLPAPGNAAAWRASLWTRLEQVMDDAYVLVEKAHFLEKVLSKKRDPVTQICFLDELCKSDSESLLDVFWRNIIEILSQGIVQGSEDSSFLRQAFEGEYPKLLHVVNNLWNRVSQFYRKAPELGAVTEPKVGLSISETGKSSAHELLKNAFSQFENVYLVKSLSRLFDPINLVFPSGANALPSREELNSIIRSISSELGVAGVDDDLLVLVAKNIAKTVQLYISKSDHMITCGPEAEQLSGGITNAQARNAAVVNSLYQLLNGLRKVVQDQESIPESAENVLNGSLKMITDLIESVLDILLNAVKCSLENKIARLHAEDFSSSTAISHGNSSGEMPCSQYVRDIQVFISTIQSDYLSLYECQSQLKECLYAMSGHVLNLFVTHVSVLRNVSESGKLKLAADMAQIEFALAPWCEKITELGRPYKLLRTFRQILFQSPDDILENPALGQILPYSIVLNFLFSKAPPELRSPHMVAGWTVTEYCKWLDSHQNEEDRLALIQGALDSHAQYLKNEAVKDASAVYRSILKVLEAAKHANSKD